MKRKYVKLFVVSVTWIATWWEPTPCRTLPINPYVGKAIIKGFSNEQVCFEQHQMVMQKDMDSTRAVEKFKLGCDGDSNRLVLGQVNCSGWDIKKKP